MADQADPIPAVTGVPTSLVSHPLKHNVSASRIAGQMTNRFDEDEDDHGSKDECAAFGSGTDHDPCLPMGDHEENEDRNGGNQGGDDDDDHICLVFPSGHPSPLSVLLTSSIPMEVPIPAVSTMEQSSLPKMILPVLMPTPHLSSGATMPLLSGAISALPPMASLPLTFPVTLTMLSMNNTLFHAENAISNAMDQSVRLILLVFQTLPLPLNQKNTQLWVEQH
jgi:hypothetical protein